MMVPSYEQYPTKYLLKVCDTLIQTMREFTKKIKSGKEWKLCFIYKNAIENIGIFV